MIEPPPILTGDTQHQVQQRRPPLTRLAQQPNDSRPHG